MADADKAFAFALERAFDAHDEVFRASERHGDELHFNGAGGFLAVEHLAAVVGEDIFALADG